MLFLYVSAVCRAVRSHEYPRNTADALRVSERVASLSLSTPATADAIDPGSEGSNYTAPSRATSGKQLVELTATGHPAPKASSTGSPNPS